MDFTVFGCKSRRAAPPKTLSRKCELAHNALRTNGATVGPHPEQEAHMTSTATIGLVATALVLSALMIEKVAPDHTVAGTDVWSNAPQTSVPAYDLHFQHPHMKTLPVQDVPEP
jgi:hypothetical protein